jgi:hypothetical protein
MVSKKSDINAIYLVILLRFIQKIDLSLQRFNY